MIPTYYNEFFFHIDKAYKPLFIDYIFELGIEALEEKDEGIILRSNEDLNDVVWAVKFFKDALCKKENKEINFHFTLEKKKNKDWIQEYKKNVAPVQIDNFYIHSSWHKKSDELINIQIDPALAFGSGHHESTHSCIKLLQKYAKNKNSALDFGCGSGILSIILAKLGFKISACDIDELAIQSSINNARANNIEFEKIWQGSISKSTEKYDLIVANLVSAIILSFEKELKNHLQTNAYLILSGILIKDAQRIKQAFKDLKLITSLENQEWLSLVYQKERK